MPSTETVVPLVRSLGPAVVAGCDHCGLPVPAARLTPGEGHSFCCAGCCTVFAMLHEHHLEGYYDERGPLPGKRATSTGRDFSEFDDESFLKRCTSQRDNCSEAELLLEGVHCSACVWLIEKLPTLLAGVVETRLNYARRLVHVTWQTDRVAPSLIARTLDRLGYCPHPHRAAERDQVLARDQRELLLRLGVAGACAGNAMLLALALYSGALQDIEVEYEVYFRTLSAFVALPAILWSAQIFFRGAWSALRTRTPHMDLPISLGIVAASLWGGVNVARGSGDIYFDSVTALIFLLLVGRYILVRQQRVAEMSAGASHALTPHTARVLSETGQVQVVSAEALNRGDRVQVLAGELFPVDGTVVAGSSQVELAWLTGEARPQCVAAGDSVCAGTTNLSGTVQVEATCTGEDTRAARLLMEVEKASLRRAPIAELADRLSAHFLFGVLLLAGVGFAIWLPTSLEAAVTTAIAVLIVTCPCALGLATPLAMSAALDQASRSGWLIKGGAFVEALAQPALIVFDKTGTLTTGHLSLVDWCGDTTLKAAVKALELQSRHPVALALCNALERVQPAAVDDIHSELGSGVEGRLNGQLIRVGRVDWCCRGSIPAWAQRALSRIEARGLSPIAVSLAGSCQAILGAGDPPRDEAAATLCRLLDSGHRLALLSGDDQSVVDHLVDHLERQAGRKLFDTARGCASPESKLAWVEHHAAAGRLFMVGDGVNDAGALAAATVGIAIHGGAEASIQAADVFATREGLAPVVFLLDGARRARQVVRLNLAFSLAYNAFAASVTLAGAISPLLAAVLMPLSSLTVVSHSYRRRMFRVEE